MTIIHLCRLYHPHVGGVETHVKKVSEVLLAQGHSVIVITQQLSELDALKETIDDIIVHRIPLAYNDDKLKTWLWMWSQRKIFFAADIIQVHDVFWWSIPIISYIKHKTFMTFHGYEGNDAPNWRKKFWHQLAAISTKANLCIGGFHEKWYGVKPTQVSFGAVEEKTKKRISKNNSIVFIGRLEKDNGIMEYLQAIKILKDTSKKYTLEVYGDGTLRAECHQYVKKHTLPVVFHNFVLNASDKLSQYSIVFVSRYLAILEALKTGKNVIAHYNNNIKYDYLRMTPFYKWITIVQTPEEIAAAVLSNTDKHTGAKNWIAHQTWENMVKTYKEIWNIKN